MCKVNRKEPSDRACASFHIRVRNIDKRGHERVLGEQAEVTVRVEIFTAVDPVTEYLVVSLYYEIDVIWQHQKTICPCKIDLVEKVLQAV
jgi:hypothetical protein